MKLLFIAAVKFIPVRDVWISWPELCSTVHIITVNLTEAASVNFVCRESRRRMF